MAKEQIELNRWVLPWLVLAHASVSTLQGLESWGKNEFLLVILLQTLPHMAAAASDFSHILAEDFEFRSYLRIGYLKPSHNDSGLEQKQPSSFPPPVSWYRS